MKPYYEDDSVTIYHGDCREILPTLGPLDAVVTSPPYGAVRAYGGHALVDPRDALSLLADALREGGVIVWNVADQVIAGSESGESFRQALHALSCGLRLHDTMIYCKDSVSFPDSNRYLPAFEFMFVFSKGAPHCFHGIRDRVNKWAGSAVHGTHREQDGSLRRASRHGQPVPDRGLRLNWWLMKTASQERERTGDTHPAQMPYAMASAHVRTWTNPGEAVVDPFMGSGTTLVAAKKLGRRTIGIEIEERYCEIAAKRLAQEVFDFGEAA